MDIDKFLNYLKYEKNFSDHTVLNYKKDLEAFYAFLKDTKINNVDLKVIRNYLKVLYDKKYSNATISRKVSTLKSYFKYLEAEKIIINNPMPLISNPKHEKKLPNYLNYNDVEKLLAVPNLKTADGQRDALMMEMLYSTGIRVSELVNIKIKDINFSEQKILILGKGNKERYAYYGHRCNELLKLYMSDGRTKLPSSEYLFPNKHGEKTNERIVRIIINDNVKKARIDVHVSPHTLRHTYATHMLNEGADLKSVGDLLGHENLSTTSIYTHVSNERLRNVYLNSHPRAKKR